MPSQLSLPFSWPIWADPASIWTDGILGDDGLSRADGDDEVRLLTTESDSRFGRPQTGQILAIKDLRAAEDPPRREHGRADGRSPRAGGSTKAQTTIRGSV